MSAVHKTDERPIAADPDDRDPWISLNAAALLRGRSQLAVALEALDSTVRKQRVGGRWFFHRDDIQALRDNGPPGDAE